MPTNVSVIEASLGLVGFGLGNRPIVAKGSKGTTKVSNPQLLPQALGAWRRLAGVHRGAESSDIWLVVLAPSTDGCAMFCLNLALHLPDSPLALRDLFPALGLGLGK